MKKFLSLFLAAALLFAVLPVAATNSSNTKNTDFFISIYDDTKKQYLVTNTLLSASDDTLYVADTLDVLKRNGIIENYKKSDKQITDISLNGNIIKNSGDNIIYVKKNGKILTAQEYLLKVTAGDIIEWIYGAPASGVSASIDSQKTTATFDFTAEYKSALERACEYLLLNNKSDSYIALGIAGKSSDLKSTNVLLNRLKETKKYTDINKLTKDILSLTSCGYNAQSFVDTLCDFSGIDKDGIYGYVNALYAYDSGGYKVEDGSLNNRSYCLDEILSYQKDDGGFAYSKNTDSDVDTTAMALIALSPYMQLEKVKTAVNAAVVFLIDNQNDDGSFGYADASDNCESLCGVITALISIGTSPDDSRFEKHNMSLVDKLLEYENTDGGFFETKGEDSSLNVTQQAVIALSAARKFKNPYITQEKLIDIPQNSANQISVNTIVIIISLVTVIILLISITAVFIIKKHKSKA